MMKTEYEKLFEKFSFPNGGEISNRIIMAPMTTNSSFENGMVTTDELNYYARRSKGLGAVITACAQVREDGRFAGSFSAAFDRRIESLSKVAEAIQAEGSKAILQIFHVGRMGSRRTLKAKQPVAPSTIPAMREDAEVPRELTSEEVEEMVTAFGEAVRRAIQAGFDGVELHGANTYLIQQFFSPHSNRRKDEWGGTIEKRMKFPLAVVDAAKKAIEEYAKKPFILGYRISPEEIEEPGITLDDTLQLLSRLKEKGLDYIHLSLGYYNQTPLRNKEEKTPVLETIVKEIGEDIPLIAVGNVRTPEDALVVRDMMVPLVAIGRQLIVEPDWALKVESGKEKEIRTVIKKADREDLTIPDEMWENLQSRPGWMPFEK